MKKRFGPAKVHLYAYLEIGGYISFERPQIGGYVAAGGGIDIDIWIIGISLSLNALLSAEAAKPFLIYAEVRFRACAKLGFIRVCKSFTVKLKWEKSTIVDRSPVSPLPSSGSVNRANELVKGIHMLTNDTFDLKFFTAPPAVGLIDKVIPLDTYIEIKTEKGLVPGAVSGKIGGYTFAPQNCVDLIPPQKVVRGGHQLRQVKHRYSIENIEIKAWNGSWQDYHPFEAVVDVDNRPNVAGLRIGYWQIKEKQYDTIRLLATTPFTYMEAGEPGWHIPEVYGITPSTLYCQEELRKEKCANVLNKPLGTIYYPPTQYIGHYINGAYFTMLNVPVPLFEDGEVTYDLSEYLEVTNAENLHGFAKSLSFNNSNGMVIILPEPSVEIKLRFTTNAQGATISYYKSVINDSTSIVQYELVNQVYKTASEINNNVIEYINENVTIAKVVINPDDADLIAIQQISEQIAELFETTYDNVSGEVSITEPSDSKLYRDLIKKLEELKGKGCSRAKDNSDPKLCGLHNHLSGLFDDHFILPVDKADEVIREQEYFNQFNLSLLVFDRENPDYSLLESMDKIYNTFTEKLDKLNYLLSVYPEEVGDKEVVEGYFEFRESSINVLSYTKERGKCGCKSNPRICELYNQLLVLYNNCFVPVKTSKDVDENIKCFLEFQSIVELIIKLVPDEELIKVYTHYKKLLDQIKNLVGHHEQILLFYRLKEYAEQILTIVNALGNCNCDDKPKLKCTTSLQQICWLSLEDHQWNLTVPGSEAIEEDFEDMTAAVQKVAQPVWRPNTNYYIRIQLKDEVDDGASDPGTYNYYYGFKTVGPVGHYHKNPASGYIPPGGNADEYPLTSLRSYIDYNRSYPNADGNILKAKPLFYGNQQCKISVFFNKPSTYHMFQTWNPYLNLPELDGQLHIAIKDPVTDVIIPYPLPVDYDETVPFPDENGYLWDEDDNPQLPVHIQVINNMIENGQLPCEIDLGEPIVPASSYFNVTLMNLRPQKLYTALLYNAFEVTNNNVVSEPVHEFVFQTSRYENFESQVKSYLIKDQETETEKQAIFTVELSLDNTAVAKALDIVSNPNSQINDPLGNSYQHLFDRVIEGVFEIIPLDPPVRTEFHKIINLITGDVVALLIKNPEPFNIPKISLEELEELEEMIAIVDNGDVNSNYKVLYSKDYSEALIMHTSAKITALTLDFIFRYYTWNGSQYIVADDVLVENININD
ncbi:MAG: hypothetical protein Q8K02_16375 [Flavobacterium sp.]|nr:hypothetical protein [Flavobacterium sp.]